MIRRIFTAMTVMALSVTVIAAPVRRGVTKTVTLTNGETIQLTLQGDEYLHYWSDAQGNRYENRQQQGWTLISSENFSRMQEQAATSRAKIDELRAERRQQWFVPTFRSSRNVSASSSPSGTSSVSRVTSERPKGIFGQRKGIVILANFADVKFAEGHDAALYNRITNEVGYNEGRFCGSVHDYFYDQSEGKFDLTFDVIGPVELSQGYAYYGANFNNSGGSDRNASQMASEAIRAADEQVDFSLYDWENNGEVDQVFIIYAGEGESSSGDPDAIWPHQSMVNLNLDGKRIRTYACGPELYGTMVDGIGTMCHEFSHCLGYPDLYDVRNHTNYGMRTWDIMDDGVNCEYGYRPCGFTGYEKWMAGWIEPIELTYACDILNLKPQSEGGETYIIYNQDNNDEYYMIDNRQKTNWDTGLPGKGLLIMHADYNERDWRGNQVNNNADHQRFTIFHADNDDSWRNSSVAADPYPSGSNNTLNNLSTPAAWLYNANSDGKKLMNVSIYNITQNEDGTMSFCFEPIDTNKPGAEGAIFYESFDKCAGSGGNDYIWTGGSATFSADNEGWTYNIAHGGNQCAMFGNAMKAGTAESPAFTLNGSATLTFSCVPYHNTANELNVYLCDSAAEKTLLGTIDMQSDRWTRVSLTMEGRGKHTLSFEPKKRMFLDEVRVVDDVFSGIDNTALTTSSTNTGTTYNLAGQKVDANYKGIVIKNGKARIVK